MRGAGYRFEIPKARDLRPAQQQPHELV